MACAGRRLEDCCLTPLSRVMRSVGSTQATGLKGAPLGSRGRGGADPVTEGAERWHSAFPQPLACLPLVTQHVVEHGVGARTSGGADHADYALPLRA